jgi:aspartyl-tRNA(Asn)/glutamyl-tRNA(Gln) amidotransferase subunit A
LSTTLDSPGPMARSVEDAAVMYWAMQGADPADPLSLGLLPEDPLPGLRRGVAGMRLGRIAPEDCGALLDPETAANYEAAIETLTGLGAVVLPISLPRPLSDYAAMTHVLAGEAYAVHGDFAEDPDSAIGPHTRARLMGGKVSARDYLRLLWERPTMAESFLGAMAPVEALLTPTTIHPAWPVAEADETRAPSEMTRAVNLLGLCALAVPSGLSAAGLPLSLQIIGRPCAEALVLRIGWAFQEAGDWHRLAPPI